MDEEDSNHLYPQIHPAFAPSTHRRWVRDTESFTDARFTFVKIIYIYLWPSAKSADEKDLKPFKIFQ